MTSFKSVTFAALLLAATACGNKSSGGSTPKGGGTTCQAAGDNVASAMIALGQADAGAAGEIVEAVVEACTADAWSADSIGCFSAADTEAALEACDGGLAEDARGRLAAAMEAILEGDENLEAPPEDPEDPEDEEDEEDEDEEDEEDPADGMDE